MHVSYFNHESVWIIPLSLICYNPPTVCVCVCALHLLPVYQPGYFLLLLVLSLWHSVLNAFVQYIIRSDHNLEFSCLYVQPSDVLQSRSGFILLFSARTSFYCFKHLKLLLLVSDAVRLVATLLLSLLLVRVHLQRQVRLEIFLGNSHWVMFLKKSD